MIRLIQPCDKHQFEKFSEGCTTGQVTWKCKVCGYEETRWPASHPCTSTPVVSQVALEEYNKASPYQTIGEIRALIRKRVQEGDL